MSKRVRRGEVGSREEKERKKDGMGPNKKGNARGIIMRRAA